MLKFGASILDGEWPNRPWPRSASAGWHEAPHIYDARCGRAGGLRVASTLRPPHLLHRSRFTNVAIGVSGMMARRDSAAPVNTPTCRQLRHSTVTVGSARNARSDITEKIGRLLPLSESTHSGQRQDSTRRASKAADKDAPLLHQQVRRSCVLATKISALHRRRDPIATNNNNGRMPCAIGLFLPAGYEYMRADPSGRSCHPPLG
jgi:hypothetical protein